MSKILTGILCVGLIVPAEAADQQMSRTAGEKNRTGQTAAAPERVTPEPLTAEEEQTLEQRSEEPGEEVAGGALSNLHLTYIVIALAAAVLVLVLK